MTHLGTAARERIQREAARADESLDAEIPRASLAVRRLADIAPESVEWLWPGRIPFGKLTLIDGDPGLGKSQLTIAIATHLSGGPPLPDCAPRHAPCTSLFVTFEDGAADTIRPRAEAAGADLSRVLVVDGVRYGDDMRPLEVFADLRIIEDAVRTHGARLLVIDPLMAALATGTDSYKDSDVRRLLAPLSQLAEATGVAVVLVRHLTKGAAGKAIYAGGGSIGIAGAARSVLAVYQDPDVPTRRVLAQVKSNLGPSSASIAFELRSVATSSALAWLGASAHSADVLTALRAQSGDEQLGGALADAQAFLRDFLAEGPKPAREVQRAARECGITERTLDRAKAKAGVRSVKPLGSTTAWMWALDRQECQGCQECQGGKAGELGGEMVPTQQERHSPSVGDVGTLGTLGSPPAARVEAALADGEPASFDDVVARTHLSVGHARNALGMLDRIGKAREVTPGVWVCVRAAA